jgi:hypothetical protein
MKSNYIRQCRLRLYCMQLFGRLIIASSHSFLNHSSPTLPEPIPTRRIRAHSSPNSTLHLSILTFGASGRGSCGAGSEPKIAQQDGVFREEAPGERMIPLLAVIPTHGDQPPRACFHSSICLRLQLRPGCLLRSFNAPSCGAAVDMPKRMRFCANE